MLAALAALDFMAPRCVEHEDCRQNVSIAIACMRSQARHVRFAGFAQMMLSPGRVSIASLVMQSELHSPQLSLSDGAQLTVLDLFVNGYSCWAAGPCPGRLFEANVSRPWFVCQDLRKHDHVSLHVRADGAHSVTLNALLIGEGA